LFYIKKNFKESSMKASNIKSIEACAAHYGADEEAMKAYLIAGEKQALAMDNRGPIKFDKNGRLAKEIRDAYSKYGFYVFENVYQENELADIKKDLELMRTKFPKSSQSKVTESGEPALGSDCKAPNLIWSKPLGDPLGGTPIAGGRHQVKLFEPEAAVDAPDESVFVILGSLQFSEACLRAYAHPDLLRVAADINGEDFAPFHESLFIKDPGLGAAVSWHQDGATHWDNPDFDENIHGFNFMPQVFGSTPVNGVWVVPGTHKLGKLDINKLVEQANSERLVGAVPLVCNPGDVFICNRQLVHGSFANSGFEPRVTVNFGFHKRSSVLNVQGAGMHCDALFFDDNITKQRTKMLGYAIDARAKQYPDETPYEYKLFKDDNIHYQWDEAAKADIKDYNLYDLSI